MNRALLIIGVPAVAVATFYAAALWGRWAATVMAVLLSLLLGFVALVDHRRREGRHANPANRG